MNAPDCPSSGVSAIDEHLLSFFQDGVRMLGLPKSLGEIYGVLFASPTPLTMHDLVTRLGISKGSASQGLKTLRTLGAVREVDYKDDRKTYFQADVELKKLVGGFIREEIRPHLQSGKHKLQNLHTEAQKIDDPELREFYDERIERLERWSRKANLVLPLLQKFLGE
ncbi:transcriptional regulator [Oceaniferula spumae]|uniref:HTH-type transcriptional regulator n=1 Tax=Oceaniferula spumae TaxID=2979115 RepID=A0AAT9FM15_9BACT